MDIWTVAPEEGLEPSPFLVTPFNEGTTAFSPNGRWMAYVSDESGQFEVYVRSYPDGAHKIAVTTGGGREPWWSPDGRELFYRNGNKMMAIEVDDQQELRTNEPRVLFEGDLWIQPGFLNRNYDVSPDGSSFLILTGGQDAPESRLNVVLNWFEELEQLVPTND